ncbi:hypothetical protein [Mucilaginibacter segetis]|uniref:Uncharacterized protein n=1 Tax=Mucilaginibacter segetis TaxID=2793071 RepID=A0A934ULT5_9SPHI|nr:hypothetical protein [Mucilaginibacter segetis]MBK0378295.1 hypothetical protein [Mucilaginibacter segetis]
MALVPAVNIAFHGEKSSIGAAMGYDSSNYGTGINKLTSEYYSPVNYSSGCLFLGVFFRLGH